MGTPRALRLALSALALLAAFAAAQDGDDSVKQVLAQAKQRAAAEAAPAAATPAAVAQRSPTDGIPSATSSRFCGSVEDCQTFCARACTFDKTKWKPDGKNDGSTTCPLAPTTGPGMIPSNSSDLQNLSDAGLQYVTFDPSERATATAIDGLRRLDAHLAASANRRKYGYKVRVVSCYRNHLEDTEPECGFVMKGKYMLDRVSDPKQVQYWREKSDPNNLGLTWPGATPHSGGIACDLVLVDRGGQDSFDSRAGVDADAPNPPPTSSIPARDASRMLDEEVTNSDVGGSRLTFEAWHYEWGGSITASRCRAPDCANNNWPITGKPPKN